MRSTDPRAFDRRVRDGGDTLHVGDEEGKEKQEGNNFGGKDGWPLERERPEDCIVGAVKEQRMPLEDGDDADDDYFRMCQRA